jgi:hypothetical protein
MKMEETESLNDEPISLEELQVLIHHPPNPATIDHEVDVTKSLSHIPWTFQQTVNIAVTTDEVVGVAATSSLLSDTTFPSCSYLDLRRHQNRAWADDRLVKGNEHYYLNPEQSDKFYQEGIDLVPDHVDLLVAQAKLWLMRRHRPLAAQKQLHEALQLDPNHPGAKELMNLLERHHEAARRRGGGVVLRKQPQTRESSVYQDVLMERNLATSLMETSDTGKEECEEKEESRSHSSSHRRSRTRKKKREKKKRRKHSKERKKKRRKRRRRYDSSSSASDEQSSIGTVGENSEEEGQRRDHKRRRRRQRRKREDSVGSSTANAESVNSPNAHNETAQSENQSSKVGDNDSSPSHRHSRHKSEEPIASRQIETQTNCYRTDTPDDCSRDADR